MYTNIVIRTQILFEDAQHRALVALSRRTGKGVSALVRGAVDRLLTGETAKTPSRRLSDMRGLGSDPGGPSAADHDRLLYGDGR